MVPFSSDFSVTIAQDISEWFSSSCMSPLCMSPLADLQHLQLTESSSSLHPWFLACDCRVHGTSHTAGILLRPGTHAQRPGLCVHGSDGVTRVGCDLCCGGIDSGKESPLAPKARVNFGGASRVRTLVLPHDPPEALAGL